MFFYVGKPQGVAELRRRNLTSFSRPRHEIPIAVIDDEPFPYSDILRKHDFNIKELGDPTDIKAVASYSIVLVDIKGVGKHFGSKYEGGHVIEEVKRYFPSKIVIAYTAYQLDPSYNRFFQLCDSSLKKDIDSDAWVDALDSAVRKVQDPIFQWKRIRKSLVDLDVDAFDIARLEDEFVISLAKPNAKFASNKVLKELSDDAKQIVLNFAASALFKSIVG